LLKSTNLATKDRYNLILIIVNKLIKYLYIIVCTNKFTIEQLKYIVLNRLIQYYNIFKKLISNRDKLFISSVIVGSNFNSIELTHSTLTLRLGKFPSSIEWGERRMHVECSTRFIRLRDVT